MEITKNSVSQMPSDINWDVNYGGHNFHVTMSFDCKNIFEIDILTENALKKEYPDDKERNDFINKMIEFLKYKIYNDNSIWTDSL